MKTLIIILLCILDIVFYTVFADIVPRKIQNPLKSILVTIIGICLSTVLLFIVVILGKIFGMFENAAIFALITFAVNESVHGTYLFLDRNH